MKKKCLITALGIAVLCAGLLQVQAATASDKATTAGNAIAQLLSHKDQAYIQTFYTALNDIKTSLIQKNETEKLKTLTTIENILLESIPNPLSTSGNNTVDLDQTKDPVVCTMEYAPVCWIDGKTYGNGCLLSASHVAKLHDGACTENKISW